MTNLGSPKSTKEPARISGNVVIARISGETVLVSGIVIVISSAVIQAEISGDWVNISGAAVNVSGSVITVASGTTYLASGQAMSVSGNWVSTSGSVVSLASGTTYIASGQAVAVPNLPTIMNDESVWLLRRIVKLLEVSAVADNKQRQIVTVEAIGRVVATGVPTELTTAIPVTLGSTTVSGNAVTVSGSVVSLSVGVSGYVNTFADFARTSYATGIRSNLSW
jgi:hypothetical protein